jgi:hypothetical protein
MPARGRQYGVAAGQSVSTMQAMQRWAFEQAGVEVPAQSALVLHSTQVDVATSQCAAGAWHCASDVQPARHLKVPGSHTGAAVPQSAFERQASHVPRPVKQRGAAAGQSVFDAHSTHSCVSPLHTFVSPAQSADVWHPTHAPVLVSQMAFAFPLPGHGPLHAAWHVWVPG